MAHAHDAVAEWQGADAADGPRPKEKLLLAHGPRISAARRIAAVAVQRSLGIARTVKLAAEDIWALVDQSAAKLAAALEQAGAWARALLALAIVVLVWDHEKKTVA